MESPHAAAEPSRIIQMFRIPRLKGHIIRTRNPKLRALPASSAPLRDGRTLTNFFLYSNRKYVFPQ